jgi:serine/threonine protein kinase
MNKKRISSVKNKYKKDVKFADDFDIIENIGHGSFGDVYLSREAKSGDIMATKVEERKKNKKTKLQLELKIYNILHKNNVQHIPDVLNFCTSRKYHFLHLELLGKSLDDVFRDCERKFDVGSVLKLGIDMIDIMKELHESGIIHRDIKPGNFMMGKKDTDKLYIMDFGLSRRYMKDGVHIKHSTGNSPMGTPRYISVNVHLGFEPSRRDDMESIGYLIIYFLKGVLPWQGMKTDSKATQIEKIKTKKMQTSIEKLCEGLPKCIEDYMKHVTALDFKDGPDYNTLKTLFINNATKLGVDLKYQWCR